MDVMEKYKDMSEEEYEALSEEEKSKIQAEIEAEAKNITAQMQQEFDKLTDEQKEEMRENMKKSQEYMASRANYTQEEVIAEMLNPETEGYSEEELAEAKRLMAQPGWEDEDYEPYPEKVHKTFLQKLISFLKRIF